MESEGAGVVVWGGGGESEMSPQRVKLWLQVCEDEFKGADEGVGRDKNWHHVGINDSVQQVNELISQSGILCPHWSTSLHCYNVKQSEKFSN